MDAKKGVEEEDDGKERKRTRTRNNCEIVIRSDLVDALSDIMLMSIFAYCPTPTIKKFRCVSNYWRTLVQSRDFFRTHMISPRNPTRLIAVHYIPNPNPAVISDVYGEFVKDVWEEEYYNKDQDPEVSSDAGGDDYELVPRKRLRLSRFKDENLERVEEEEDRDNFVDFTQGEPFAHRIHIIGPVDGLFLLHRSLYNMSDGLALWNPALREFQLLPKLPFHVQNSEPCVNRLYSYIVGFGFNPHTDTYDMILVPIFSIHKRDNPAPGASSVALFTFRPDADAAWRINGNDDVRNLLWKCKHGPSCTKNFSGACFNGVIYWIVECRCSFLLISYHLDTQKFREILAPERVEFSHNLLGRSRLVQNEDSIALLAMEYTPGYIRRLSSINGWVMREQGQWIKQFSITRDSTSIGIRYPLGFWKTEEELFVECTELKLGLYNCDTRTLRYLGVSGLANPSYSFLRVFKYKESVVSVNRQNDNLSWGDLHEIIRDFLENIDATSSDECG